MVRFWLVVTEGAMQMTVTPESQQSFRLGLQQEGLDILGGFTVAEGDALPDNAKSLLLIGPNQDFWEIISASPEMKDGAADPIDRWSRRVISALAEQVRGQAVFPFDGPPYHPFYSWALKTGRIWSSPVKLAVHDTYGLFVSFRGAVTLPYDIDLPAQNTVVPCIECEKPCLSACPVGALTPDEYVVSDCHNFLDSGEGASCMSMGCAVRRSCPVGQDKRSHAQSEYHMQKFHKTH